jgi:hypothetical protein
VNCELLIVNGICVLRTILNAFGEKKKSLSSVPAFHYSIIPGWKRKNSWLGIPYYQQFVEIPLHGASGGHHAAYGSF